MKLKFNTREFLCALLGAMAFLSAPPSLAQQFPERPVRMIVPFAPGGRTDILARLLAQKLTEMWGRNVLVENRAGAGTVIGSEVVATSPPDGYTLLFTANPHSSNPALIAKLPYDTARDFSPVTMLVSAPLMLVVNPALPVKTVQQLVAYAKANPGALTYASSGNGGPQHMAGELFKYAADVNLVHAPYKGGAPALMDLLGNQVQVSFTSLLASEAYLKSGKLRALGVTSTKRVQRYADIPTLVEAGLPGFEYLTWYGVFAPGGTPRALLVKIQEDLARALATPEIQDRLARDGLQAVGNKPEEFDRFVKDETEVTRKLVTKAGIKPG